MSLYGALYAGVGGLKAQSSKIGIISDNIANVNTTGYKATKAAFESLVVNTSASVRYAPGGVIASSVQLVDRQGILSATDSATDIAISGNGMFAVSSNTEGSGLTYYTRAGGFSQDSLGNFQNTQGFYLLAWPLDAEGRLPGEPGNINTTSSANLDSLEVVNIETQSGVAVSTTQIDVGMNLNANEPVQAGAGVNFKMDVLNNLNYGNSASSIIVPGGPNNLTVGDAMTVQTGSGLSYTFQYGGFTTSNAVAGGILNANSETQYFLANSGGFSADELQFTVTVDGTLYTFKYKASSPNSADGEFNNLTNLAAALNATGALDARIVGGRLYTAPKDARLSMTWANVNAGPYANPPVAGTSAPDWVGQLGFTNTAVTTANRFATMSGLANLVNEQPGISASVTNPLSDTSMRIYVDDPLDTISYYDGTDTNPATITNTGSILRELGMYTHANYDNSNGNNSSQITALSPIYNPGSDGTGLNGYNMASGDIAADFSRNITIYDALGQSHELRVSYLKIGTNTWGVEVHAIPEADISVAGAYVDGQVATGTITFNGDGSLRSVTGGLNQPFSVNWVNGALPSEIAINWGTAGLPTGTAGATQFGLTDGLSQFAGDYKVNFTKQNGAQVGELLGVNIDKEGYVIASYSNGETKKLYKIPIADFTNPNGLQAVSGNVYTQTQGSGEVNLREAGTSGTGSVVSAALESSNVELADELTDMIVAQRAYQANSKVISTSDELLEELTRL